MWRLPSVARLTYTPIVHPTIRLRSTVVPAAAQTVAKVATTASIMTASWNPLHIYRSASRTAPLVTAFATCWVKGSASDDIAQLQLEGKERVDWNRNLAFGFFSGAYLGIGQHLIYNVAFARVFGTKTDLFTGLKKVVADSTIHVPCIYLPLYYPFKTVVLGEGSARDGLVRYTHDAREVLGTYWSMWPAVHFTSFTVIPQELRIGFVASVSFVWLIYLSYASHKSEDRDER